MIVLHLNDHRLREHEHYVILWVTALILPPLSSFSILSFLFIAPCRYDVILLIPLLPILCLSKQITRTHKKV